jgi:L-asparaginase / beta-aspartyl-peptidase
MIAIAIHGGAGTLPRNEMSREREHEYRDGLSQALQVGFQILDASGDSIDAVERAVAALEDNPLFNAGRGSVFTHEGRNELDAAIMDGNTLAAGAACGLTRIKNPIELARRIMRRSEFLLLSGAGAEQFAQTEGMAFVAPEYFHTDERRRQLERILAGERGLSPLTISHVGTVGAVAVDARGNLAAATSTGGMTGKRYGRIGDSPIIGAGTYADNRACAVSATGHGEKFILAAVAHDICARMRYGGRSLHTAVDEVVHGELVRLQGEGGVIAIDARANVEMQFNTEGMFRASRRSGEPEHVAIFAA